MMYDTNRLSKTNDPIMRCTKQMKAMNGCWLGTGVIPTPVASTKLAITCNQPSVVAISNKVIIVANRLLKENRESCHTPSPLVWLTHSMMVGTDAGPDRDCEEV